MFSKGLLLLLGLLPLLPQPGWAHRPSESYLQLDLRSEPPALRWDIALLDLDLALGLDADLDGRLTWGEVRRRQADVAGYALAHLRLSAGHTPCALAAEPRGLSDRGDGRYAVLALSLDCGHRRPDRIAYDLLFEFDATHRGVLRLISTEGEQSLVLSQRHAAGRALDAGHPDWFRTLLDYGREGVRHIWLGVDHLLFLLVLLLPTVLRRESAGWRVADSGRAVAGEVLAVVTAFTVAHSLTLALAVFELLTLPSAWVESTIAVTVALAAINNLYPFLPGRAWAIAFALGLVHGLGFASVLIELGLPEGALASALVGFNLGVELGQIGLVALFVPLAFLARRSRAYRVAGLQGGSGLAIGVAALWLAERSLGLSLLPF